MNFGKWIVVAFVFFAIFIGTLVTVCVKQDINLVSKSYYNDELKYQEQIGRITNTNKLSLKPTIVKIENSVRVQFDDQYKIQNGELKLFCPSDPTMDKEFNFSSTSGNEQLFEINSLQRGMYKARLRWTMNDKEYFLEEIIYI
jgi:hypothetical protein